MCVSCMNRSKYGVSFMVVSWWMSRRLMGKCLQFHARHVMGFGYMFECWFVVDAIVELEGWCDYVRRRVLVVKFEGICS